MANKKIIISERVEDISPYDLETNLADLRDKIQKFIDKYGPTAKLDWDAYFHHPYDSNPSPRFNIIRNREETDEECEIRVKKEKEDKAVRQARDRAEFERLKKVLGES